MTTCSRCHQELIDKFHCGIFMHTNDDCLFSEEYDRWEAQQPVNHVPKGICSQCGCNPCETPGVCASDARRDEGYEPRTRRQEEDW